MNHIKHKISTTWIIFHERIGMIEKKNGANIGQNYVNKKKYLNNLTFEWLGKKTEWLNQIPIDSYSIGMRSIDFEMCTRNLKKI